MQLSTARLFPFALAAQHNLINGKLVESHAANAATFAVKTLAGGDPSADDPVMCIFPDASILTITAALSLVIPAGIHVDIGAYPCRLWFALVNDAGTPRIVARRNVTTNVIIGFDARGVLSCAAGANAVVTNYCPVAITNKPYRVIAYADYESGQPTAGQWTVSPTRIMMVNPQTPMPGSVVQDRSLPTVSQLTSQTGGWTGSNCIVYITPQSNIHPVKVTWAMDFLLNCAASYEYCYMHLTRAGTLIGADCLGYGWAATVVWGAGLGATVLDFPSTVAQTYYQVYFRISINGGNILYVPHSNGGSMNCLEMMV
jgi:hypothetical protein